MRIRLLAIFAALFFFGCASAPASSPAKPAGAQVKPDDLVPVIVLRGDQPEAVAAISKAQESIKYTLKDPNSAMFRDEAVFEAHPKSGKRPRVVCGQVNAKNSYGGYTGFTHYIYSENSNTSTIRDRKSDSLFDMMRESLCAERK